MSDGDETVREPNDTSKGMGFTSSKEHTERQQALAPEAQPLHPEDFYMEGPYLVFTAAYHLRRGYCCKSDCRHCPYK